LEFGLSWAVNGDFCGRVGVQTRSSRTTSASAAGGLLLVVYARVVASFIDEVSRLGLSYQILELGRKKETHHSWRDTTGFDHGEIHV
jgi:hypothetical protein